MKIAMGADINGFHLKEEIKAYLEELGHEITDMSTLSEDTPVKYYDIVEGVAHGVQNKDYERGILFCGTGMGVGILANKYQGIYAACVETYWGAVKSRAINNANVLTMGGWIMGARRGREIAEAWLNTNLGDGLEDFRKPLVQANTGKLAEFEAELFKNQGK